MDNPDVFIMGNPDVFIFFTQWTNLIDMTSSKITPYVDNSDFFSTCLAVD